MAPMEVGQSAVRTVSTSTNLRCASLRFDFSAVTGKTANPVATLILIPLISAPQVLGILFWDDFEATVWSSLLVTVVFVATYLFGIGPCKKGAQYKCIRIPMIFGAWTFNSGLIWVVGFVMP